MLLFDNITKLIHNMKHSGEGEIKPFGYEIKKFIRERVFKMEARKRVKGKEPFDYDEELSRVHKEAEQVALAAYFTVEMPDERLILIESYCRTCKNKTMRIFSTKTRRLICTGCGKELARL